VNATDLPALVNLFFTAELNNLPSSGVESLQANKLMFRFWFSSVLLPIRICATDSSTAQESCEFCDADMQTDRAANSPLEFRHHRSLGSRACAREPALGKL